MNIVLFLGRVTRQPKVGTGQSGTKYATFSIAVDRRYSGKDGSKEDVDFFDAIVFNRANGPQLADTAEKHLKPGKPVILRGEMQNRKWKDSQGNDRVSSQIVAESIEFLPIGKRDGAGGGSGEAAPAAETAAAPAGEESGEGENFDWSSIS